MEMLQITTAHDRRGIEHADALVALTGMDEEKYYHGAVCENKKCAEDRC